ncbi:MAG: carboxy-S-adenosyl-L-methionine synthase CmoA [Pseudomonadota bacterium]
MNRRDDLYTRRETTSGSFRFDEQVVDVFPDMIDRSVPGYALLVPMIGQLARRFVQPGSTVHDLGCSLGAVTLAVRAALKGREDVSGIRLIATDNAEAMVARFDTLLGEADVPHERTSTALLASSSSRINASQETLPVLLCHGDIREVPIENASFAALNFTLQFLEPEDRDQLLSRLSQGLRPGGALVLAEKVHFDEAATARRQTDWHHDYKRLQGYSELEIARKRAALERVLLAETETVHMERLRRCGFRRVTRWFQCFGFHAWLAER